MVEDQRSIRDRAEEKHRDTQTKRDFMAEDQVRDRAEEKYRDAHSG